MTNRYIIKNCPQFTEVLVDGSTELCGYFMKCKDNPDCLLKRIVEKCKESYKSEWAIECNNFRDGRYTMARDIINLFEIEECE